jgi:uncharacterized protein YaeQ
MAINATIFKIDVNIADMDRNYYEDHSFTIARHPSETDERMMVRILAFILNADKDLIFTKGVSSEDDPDLWQKDLTGNIVKWIELGQPDEKRVRKACGRSKEVIICCYSGRSATNWWEQMQGKFERFANLWVINFPANEVQSLAKWTERSLKLQCTVQEKEIWLTQDSDNIHISPAIWKQPR